MLLYVLGTSQDGGYPQIGCEKSCCKIAWENPTLKRLPSSIAIIDKDKKRYWLIDITPEIKPQIKMLESFNCSLSGIFLTHAHIGHYMGLVNLGLEVMNVKEIPVFAMPRMREFLINNPLLNQLVENNNIHIKPLSNRKEVFMDRNFRITPFKVPHRNELSETVGFRIRGLKKTTTYIPDIDTWDEFEENLIHFINTDDIVLIDGTFFNKSEINLRDISKIPHPEIIDTMNRLAAISPNLKRKIYFTHLNHTNDACRNDSDAYKLILSNGFNILSEGQQFELS